MNLGGPSSRSRKLLVVGFRVSGVGIRRVTGAGVRVTGFGSRETGFGFRGSGYGSRWGCW